MGFNGVKRGNEVLEQGQFIYRGHGLSEEITGNSAVPEPHPMARVLVLQPLSTQALAPDGFTMASEPMIAKLAGFLSGRALLVFLSRTIPSRAIALATSLWLPWTFGPPFPLHEENWTLG